MKSRESGATEADNIPDVDEKENSWSPGYGRLLNDDLQLEFIRENCNGNNIPDACWTYNQNHEVHSGHWASDVVRLGWGMGVKSFQIWRNK